MFSLRYIFAAYALKSELGSTHQVVKIIMRWTGDDGRNGSRCDCRLAPCQHSLIAKHAQGSARDQMALDVEHIVDGGVG